MNWLLNFKSHVIGLLISLRYAVRSKLGNPLMTYPDTCIRGLNAQQYVYGNGRIASSAFDFKPGTNRTDNGLETSINWKDDESAISFTLDTKKQDGSDELVYKIGVAILPRAAIDQLNSSPPNKGMIFYERKPCPYNRYHGNIVIITEENQLIKQIQASLAINSRFISQPART